MLAHKFYAIHALLGIYIPAWLRVNIVQLGVCNKTVEIDETQIGHRKHGRGRDKRVAIVFDMIERGTGWTFTIPVINVKAKTLFPHILRHVKKRSRIISVGTSSYRRLSEVYNHLYVNHSKTYMLHFRSHQPY